MQTIEICSDRTIIKPFSPEDAEEVFSCISLEITRFMGWEPPRTKSDFAAVWREWLPAIHDRSDLHLVARRRADGQCLGIIGLHALRSGTPELGIWLRHDVHGRGLGRELIGAVATWTTKNFSIEYFEYPVAEENVASRRIAEGFGGSVMERRTSPKYSSVVYHIPPLS